MIAALARALDMGVTAEGVETEDQAELARLAGCDQLQGWLYHRALSAAEIDQLIDAQERAAPGSGEAGGTASA